MAALGEPLRAAVAALLLLSWGAHGLYFHIGETEKRCFIEGIPDETMVIGAGGGGGGGDHREWRGVEGVTGESTGDGGGVTGGISGLS